MTHEDPLVRPVRVPAERERAGGDRPVRRRPLIEGVEAAAAIVRELSAQLIVAMHYRTDAVNFLDPPDAFLAAWMMSETDKIRRPHLRTFGAMDQRLSVITLGVDDVPASTAFSIPERS